MSAASDLQLSARLLLVVPLLAGSFVPTVSLAQSPQKLGPESLFTFAPSMTTCQGNNNADCLADAARAQCAQDSKLAEFAYENCLTNPPNAQACEVSRQRLNSSCETLTVQLPSNYKPDVSRLTPIFWLMDTTSGSWPPYTLYDRHKFRLVVGPTDQSGETTMVCAVPLMDRNTREAWGTIPGKILNNNCNVAYNGGGTEYHEFLFAALWGQNGYWGEPKGDPDQMLTIYSEKGFTYPESGKPWPVLTSPESAKFTVCQANYTRKEGAVNIFGLQVFPQDVDKGSHIGWLAGDGCHFEWGGQEITSTRSLLVYYLHPPPVPPSPPPAKPGTPHSGACGTPGQPACTVRILGCTINPGRITLGGSAVLTVNLSEPAPPGGVTVIINTISDGAQDTLAQTPVALTFQAGKSSFEYTVQTRAVLNPAHRIIFSAQLGSTSRSAELDVN